MIKKALLATAAVLATSAPAYAQEITSSLNFTNNIQTSVVNSSNYASNLNVNGGVTVGGTINVDTAATAQSDDKQINDGNTVVISPATDATTGGALANGTSSNFANSGNVDADGNVGVNAASGYYNVQANIGTIGVATADGNGTDTATGAHTGSMAKSNTTAAQSTTNTFYGSTAATETTAAGTYADSNLARTGTVSGSGNIGSNSAAGAFNSQQNIMTLAVATDAALADASAGVVQYTNANYANPQATTNSAVIGGVTGAGNIAVNNAAGVGNLQHNSLTVSASGAFGGGAGTGGLAGNGGFGG